MNATGKSTRDGVLPGGTAAIVATLLQQHGVSASEAVLISGAAAFIVARAYRLLRARWGWLSAFDPSTP